MTGKWIMRGTCLILLLNLHSYQHLLSRNTIIFHAFITVLFFLCLLKLNLSNPRASSTHSKYAALWCGVSVLIEYLFSQVRATSGECNQKRRVKREQTNTSNREHVKHCGRDERRRNKCLRSTDSRDREAVDSGR